MADVIAYFFAALAAEAGPMAPHVIALEADLGTGREDAVEAHEGRYAMNLARATCLRVGARALRRADDPGTAEGLESLRDSQAGYIAAMLRDEYMSRVSHAPQQLEVLEHLAAAMEAAAESEAAFPGSRDDRRRAAKESGIALAVQVGTGDAEAAS
jgi:hypothetical protein